MNSISHLYHLSIRTKHVSVSRTEPFDGFHYVFHAGMMKSETALGAPSIRLVLQWVFPSKLAAFPAPAKPRTCRKLLSLDCAR